MLIIIICGIRTAVPLINTVLHIVFVVDLYIKICMNRGEQTMKKHSFIHDKNDHTMHKAILLNA